MPAQNRWVQYAGMEVERAGSGEAGVGTVALFLPAVEAHYLTSLCLHPFGDVGIKALLLGGLCGKSREMLTNVSCAETLP